MLQGILLTAAVPLGTSLLTGCGSGTPGQPAGDGSSNGRKVINFWSQQFEDWQSAWEKKHVAAFNASQKKFQVNLQIVPADAWAQKLKAAQAAGNGPDVYTISYGNIGSAVSTGALAPLNDLIKGQYLDDIDPSIAKFVSAKSSPSASLKQYAYPWLVEPSTVMFYRKDLFQAAGLDPDKPPTRWDQLPDIAAKLKKGNVYGLGTASVAADLSWSSWGLQQNAAGHYPVKTDWSSADPTIAPYQELANFYKSLYTSGGMPKQALSAYADGTPLGQGKLAMQITGSWFIGLLRQQFPKMEDKIAAAPMVSIDGDQTRPTATLGGWTLAIDAKSKVQEGAADFITYMLASGDDVMMDYFKASGWSKYATRTSIVKAIDADSSAQADPFRKLITDKIVKYGVPEATYPIDLSTDMATAIEKTMKGTSADQALATAKQQMNQYINNNKLVGTNTQSSVQSGS
ncbi:ABC transporter substrate-binding protein [Humibacter ginsenosidimutans]|uniref:ABC transporter substrate-binding protein n=1 Tax=Humibacter ginsenosidimutans TaxID=2599293 RepID=UPI00143CC2D3|nr:extracellular solute-binding protein [Humibacter ginsenosidimutans]